MRIFKIICGKEKIRILSDLPSGSIASVSAFIPLINALASGKEKYPGRRVFSDNVTSDGGELTIPRNPGFDLLVCRFEISVGKIRQEGPSYVNGFDPGFSASYAPYPEVKRPIGTWCIAEDEDIEYMRMGVMMDEIDEAWLFSSDPKKDDLIHVWNNREYRFDRAHTELHDRYLSKLAAKGIPVLIRFINRKKFQNLAGSDDLFELIRHPGYESDFEGAEMSAVNLRTEEGFERFCACLDFIFSRYAAEGSRYGSSAVMDVGNEVNSARIWHNAGEMICEAFMEEYSVALRLASLLAKQYRSDYGVDISLEMNFNRPYIDDPLHYYPARRCLDLLAEYCRRDGDFDWGVSAHPYPENLDHPDFYNDPTPTFDLDTPIITMKNLEVWSAFLTQPEFLYDGAPRRLVFDEQGFNTRTGEPVTEQQGVWAFVLAYLKIRSMPKRGLIPLKYFLIHRHTDLDDGDEYGLHLGLRYFGGYADNEHLFPAPGPRKPICDAIAAMGTDNEERFIELARDNIGHELFDSLLTFEFK